MKLKYYIRTLGIGIFVTALILGFSNEPDNPNKVAEPTENQATENKVLSEIASETKESERNETFDTDFEAEPEQIESVQTETGEIETEETESEETESEETESEQIESEPAESDSIEVEQSEVELPEQPEPEQSKPEQSGEIVNFEIRRGDSSDKVSRRLEQLGLVENAKSFDAYLCKNGYDKRISVGNYEIAAGCSEEDIALIISGKKKK